MIKLITSIKNNQTIYITNKIINKKYNDEKKIHEKSLSSNLYAYGYGNNR